MKNIRRSAMLYRLRNIPWIGLLAVGIVLTAACATIGVPAPKSFEDHVANAYTALTAARDTSTILARNGKLDKKDFEVFIKQCDSARESIELARELHALDAPAGQERLDSAITILNALNAYLTKRQRGEAASPPGATSNVIEKRRRVAGVDHSLEFADQGERAGGATSASGDRRPWD